MFSRILFLLPFVALAVANPLVARSDISALQTDIKQMEQTVIAIQSACNTFKADPTQVNAMRFAATTQDLDNQIKHATTDVPDHVVSDADGQEICTTLKDFFPHIIDALDCLISAKSSFGTAHVPPSAVCSVTDSLSTDNTKFIGRLDAASPASTKACSQDLTSQVVAKAGDVKAAYNC
ncbi:hypothetical protein EDD18DRAFT_1363143 [Armillaria luteobubalina]|uniref:Uncharacterized protein n=1 Tax=Armillaria luteobubalina TaxID=153913 RepID=A0AA39PD61_9AGAR|nr:hypothetical protein EDD18DRAFT_1363143 [Armillaria luteobubalina]